MVPGKKKYLMAERRRQVADLLRKGMPQRAIAEMIGTHESTVCRDLAAIRGAAHAEAVADVTSVRDAELAKLDRIETEGAERFKATGRVEYLRVQVECMRHRAALLSLTGATRVELTTSPADAGDLRDDERRALVVRRMLAKFVADGMTPNEARDAAMNLGVEPEDLETAMGVELAGADDDGEGFVS